MLICAIMVRYISMPGAYEGAWQGVKSDGRDDDRGSAMKIAVASGKGGTGKTMVAGNLATVLSRHREVVLADCDVEEPNLHLFFPAPGEAEPVTIPVPWFDETLCTRCGKCAEACRFGAVTVLKDRILFLPSLCHACGGCLLACPEGAVSEGERRVGEIRVSHPNERLRLVSGFLDPGEIHAPRVVRAVKERAGDDPLVILDAPPGISCPVIETLEGCDACLLVTESTPFGLHDLALAAELAAYLGVPAGVVINRSDGADEGIRAFAQEKELPILLTIPFDRRIAEVQSRGGLICNEIPGWEGTFSDLAVRVETVARGTL
jgi:MinD superfamily P-loop ATPase